MTRPDGWPGTDEDWDELAERRRLAHEARGRSAGLPKKWWGLRWADLDEGESAARAAAIRAARRWAMDEEARGLYLSGPVGLGKTRIAATAAVQRLSLAPVRWLSVSALMMKLSLDFKSPERAQAMRALDPPTFRPGAERLEPTLVLDDLDKVRASDYQLAPLYTAINGWIEEELPLLVTANASLDELEEKFGGDFGTPIASRLAEHCERFEIRGRDRRVDP